MTEPISARPSPDHSKPPGRITGTCRTAAGAPVAGLRVNVFSPDGIVVDTQLTDARGRYSSRLLYEGIYRVQVGPTARGPLRVQQCEVRLGETTRLDFTLDCSDPRL